MPNILILSHSYEGDGASQVLLEAANHWSRQLGWRMDAALPKDVSPQAQAALQAAGINPISHLAGGNRYHFVLINCLLNIGYVDLLPSTIPVILWAHEAETLLRVKPEFGLRLREQFARLSLLLFQTPWQYQVYREYLQGLPQPAIAYVPNGVNCVPLAKASSAPGPLTLCQMGKITPLKGQAQLIEAVVALSHRCAVHCHLIGGTEFISYLPPQARSLLQNHPQLFQLHGHLPHEEALALVANSDLFCFPSQAESFGLAPLEAAAQGVPVILSDLQVYSHVGWKAEENCLMHPAGSAEGLINAIEKIRQSPALKTRLVQSGLALASRFPQQSFLDQATAAITGHLP
jgi:glycosyltransferase involved in cell wall biosynthesis